MIPIAELDQFIDKGSRAKDTFYEKALVYQQAKNMKRQPAKRWNDTKVDRAVDKMWAEILDSVLTKVENSMQRRSNPFGDDWQKFMNANEILESLEESMSELSFTEE